MLIGRRIDPGLETDAVESPVVPPLPSCQSRAYPRHVFETRRFGQPHDHVVIEQLPVLAGNEDRSPRERSPGCGLGDEIVVFIHDVLEIVMSAVMRTLRIRCENTAQGVPLTGIIEVHARIGLQVGLGKAEFHTVVGSHDQWQESQSCRIELRKSGYGIEVLERSLELAPERDDLSTVAVPHIGYPTCPVLRKSGARLFGSDNQRPVRRGNESVGDSIIVGSKFNGETLPEISPQPVIVVCDPLFNIKRRRKRSIDHPFADAGRLRRTSPHGPVVQRHRHRRRSHDRSTVDTDLIGDPVPDRQCNPDRPVGRMDRITFFAGSGSNA